MEQETPWNRIDRGWSCGTDGCLRGWGNGDLESLLHFRVVGGVGGNGIRILWVDITALCDRLSFIVRLPLSSDPLGCRQFALFRLILGKGDDLTKLLVEFLLQPGEVLPLEGDQTALLQSGLASLHGDDILRSYRNALTPGRRVWGR